MKITFCCPTRNKVGQIGDFVNETLRNARLDTTRVSVGFDEDDETRFDAYADLKTIFPNHKMDERLLCTVAPREDALGEKYNRCAAACPGDVYIQGLDDVAIATPGWDEILAKQIEKVPDRICQVWMGQEPHGEPWPSFIAVTKEWVEAAGFFCPPLFAFWWNNTWVEELGQLTQRIFETKVETRYPKTDADFKVPPRRNVVFFAKLFDETRPYRLKQAAALMAKTNDPRWRREQILEKWPLLCAHFEHRNSMLRNPTAAARYEGVAENEADLPRYDRLKVRGKEFLNIIGE